MTDGWDADEHNHRLADALTRDGKPLLLGGTPDEWAEPSRERHEARQKHRGSRNTVADSYMVFALACRYILLGVLIYQGIHYLEALSTTMHQVSVICQHVASVKACK